MLNKVFLIIGIIFIILPFISFILNETTHITGFAVLGASGYATYNGKIIGSDWDYENNIHKNEEGIWVDKNDFTQREYVDPSEKLIRKLGKILPPFFIISMFFPLLFLGGAILIILSLYGVFL
jgi:hypothetical protein